jgi:glycosyltransferase involved in cell wall biosynthesis
MVLRAFLRKEMCQATLVLVGSEFNDYAKSLMAFEATHRTSDRRVCFLERLEQETVADAYCSADVFAFGSKSEVQPLVILEAPGRALFASPAILAIQCSAADVFVVPSLAESLGIVGMESIACGTPVVGSDVGGIPDVVRAGVTGWLFAKGDSGRLAEILGEVCADRSLASALSAGCRAGTLLATSGARSDRRTTT